MRKKALVLISMNHQCHCCHRHLAGRKESKYKQRCRKVKRPLSPSFANSHSHDKQPTPAYLTCKDVPKLILICPQTAKLSRMIYQHFSVSGVIAHVSLHKNPQTSGWHLRSEAVILHGFNLNARMATKKKSKRNFTAPNPFWCHGDSVLKRHSLRFASCTFKLAPVQLGHEVSLNWSHFRGKNSHLWQKIALFLFF